MKKLIYIILLLGATSCAGDEVTRDNGVYVQRFTENGHKYFVVTTNLSRGMDCIHDPDCPKCKGKK